MTHTLYAAAITSSFECATAPDIEQARERSRMGPAPLGSCGRFPQRSLLWCMPSPRDSISDELESLVSALRALRRADRARSRTAPGGSRRAAPGATGSLLARTKGRASGSLRGLRSSRRHLRRARHHSAPSRRPQRVARRERSSARRPSPTPAAGPAELLDQSELAQRVATAVDGLAPARRAAVRLYLDGYRREEIAELLRNGPTQRHATCSIAAWPIFAQY